MGTKRWNSGKFFRVPDDARSAEDEDEDDRALSQAVELLLKVVMLH